MPDMTYDGIDRDSRDFPMSPPPYDWEQAGEVADIVVRLMEFIIKQWEDEIEALEGMSSFRDIRTQQGVGIVLAGMLASFKASQRGGTEEEAATAQAFYYLEDF